LIARLIDVFGRIEAKDVELDREQLIDRVVREQVGGEKTGAEIRRLVVKSQRLLRRKSSRNQGRTTKIRICLQARSYLKGRFRLERFHAAQNIESHVTITSKMKLQFMIVNKTIEEKLAMDQIR
jgi:hypothetical protein